MSHEISEIDSQEGIEMGWHGLTIVKSVIILAKCKLAQWDIVKRTMGIVNSVGKFVSGEYVQLVCTDNEEISIGAPVHSETYSVLTNAGFLAIVQSALDRWKCMPQRKDFCFDQIAETRILYGRGKRIQTLFEFPFQPRQICAIHRQPWNHLHGLQ